MDVEGQPPEKDLDLEGYLLRGGNADGLWEAAKVEFAQGPSILAWKRVGSLRVKGNQLPPKVAQELNGRLWQRLNRSTREEVDDADGESDLRKESRPIIDLVARLLKIPNLVISVKAAILQDEHSKVFIGAKITDDIRPVFNLDSDSFSHVVLPIKLKLEFADQDGPQEFFMTLRETDLETLRRACDRATDKLKAIKASINWKVVGLTPNND